MEARIIRPQEGFQLKFLSTKADIAIGGGAAGVGKTFSLLTEPLRHINVKDFGGVIFRRTSPQIRLEGGLWDTSMKMYNHVGARPKESSLEWIFPKGAKLKFSHLEYEKNKNDWQGAQIPFIAFDELTHFTESMFFYLLSRNRSTCGVKPYVRATCNPDPDSWVLKLIEWWIDSETGFPIPERDGVVRYFIKYGEDYIWGDSFDEVKEKAWFFLEDMVWKSDLAPENFIKSITFISGSVYDNRELLAIDPNYLANLLSQDEATRLSLLDGNWKHVVSANDIYDYAKFLDMFHNVFDVQKTPNATNGRYITADIALKGSDKFIVGVWYGKELVDILIMDKSDGKEVIDGIKLMAMKHKVSNSNILYDSDGVGGFIDGFIVGANPFNGGATALKIIDPISKKTIVESYENLKTQLIYRSGSEVLKGHYRISEEVANKEYDKKMTVRDRLIYERKAFKRDKADFDGKKKVMKKDQMKIILQGQSPDLMDMFFMREWFDVKASLSHTIGVKYS